MAGRLTTKHPVSSPTAPKVTIADDNLKKRAAAILGMDNMPATVVLTDADGIIQYVNPCFLRTFGCQESEATGSHLNAFWSHASRQWPAINAQLHATGTWQGDVEHRTKDGLAHREWVSISAVKDERGAIVHLVKIGQPSPHQRPTEPHRETGGIDYRRMLENSGDGYFEVDLAGSFTFVNDAACRFTGRPREKMVGLNYRDFMAPEEAQRIYRLYHEVYRTGLPSELMEYQILREDGAVATNQTVVTLLCDAIGNPTGFCGVVRDLTEQKAMEQALRESEESYRRVLELAPDAITINDARTSKYIQVNAAFCQHTGYTPEEIIGRTPIELNLYVDPADDQRIQTLLAQEGRIDGLEVRLQNKPGERFDDLVSARMIRFKGKTCTLFVATVITPLKQAHQALRESEKRYREIMETAPDAICLTTLSDGRYIEANSEFYRRTGFTPEETIGFTSRDLNIYADPNDRQKFIGTLQSKGRVDHFEVPVRYKDGTVSEQLWSARIIEQNGQKCLLIIARPIDDLKAAQRSLVESEESYRRIMELAPDMIVITRKSDGRILAVNDAFCTRTGFSREELVGRTPMEMGLYTDPDIRRRWLEILRRDGKVQGIELQFLNRQGTVQDDLFSAQYIRFKGEECVLAVVTSITNLKQTQRALQEKEESQRTILETAPYSIAIVRRSDLQYMQVNKSFYLNTGYGRDEVIGHTAAELHLFADPADRDRMEQDLLRHGRFDGMEIRIRKKDGSFLETLVSCRPLTFEQKSCLLFISADITALKKTQRELERYRNKLEQMVAERTSALEAAQNELVKREKLAVLGQLTATVSHELRNPLGVIRSSNYYLQRKIEDKTEKNRKHFRRIEEQVALCDTIVADLLEYTRGRSISAVQQALAPWMTEVVEQLREAEGVDISLIISEDLPQVHHDREKMRRVLINVLDNAIQAVREKARQSDKHGAFYRPVITVKTETRPDTVIITITDNGVGMDQETCRRAFEPLFTTRARGTGIGLANVKKIVEEHGGQIVLTCQPGEGTRMQLALPCENRQ